MILKASQRSGGQDLAAHLMRVDENEHVSLHDLRGFTSETLKGALKEAHAVSLGTKCHQYLFSLSLNPPEGERVAHETFEGAIARVEERLGLSGYPRAIVFHEKDGRRHAHCVWSRIDAQSMTARHLPFFKNTLTELSRELYLENGWKLPRGLNDKKDRDPLNFTHAEWQAAKRNGEDPRWLKSVVQYCWASSDTRKGFEAALAEKSLHLAKGDKCGFVVLDYNGAVHSLPRLLGLKTKEVKAKLGDAPPRELEEIKQESAARLGSEASAKIKASRERFAERQRTLKSYREEITHLHRVERSKLAAVHSTQWTTATKERQARFPRGLRGLWSWMTGKTAQIRKENIAEAEEQRAAQQREREEQIRRQAEERHILQEKIKELRYAQAQELIRLRRELASHMGLRREGAPKQDAPSVRLGLKLEH